MIAIQQLELNLDFDIEIEPKTLDHLSEGPRSPATTNSDLYKGQQSPEFAILCPL